MQKKEPLEVYAPTAKKKTDRKIKPEEFDVKTLLDVYEFDVKLPGSHKELKIKPMTTGQLKKALIYENEDSPEKIEDVLDDLISGCVLDDDFDINSLYLQDRFFLLLEIRNKTKGETYSFNYKCPKCKNEYLKNVNLGNLKVKEKMSEYGVVEISSKLKAVLDFPTRGDQREALEYLKMISGITDGQKIAELSTYTYATAIKEFVLSNGDNKNPSLEDRIYIIENTPRFTFEKIKEWFEENDFGVEFKFDLDCPNCKEKREVEIPLTNFFV